MKKKKSLKGTKCQIPLKGKKKKNNLNNLNHIKFPDEKLGENVLTLS